MVVENHLVLPADARERFSVPTVDNGALWHSASEIDAAVLEFEGYVRSLDVSFEREYPSYLVHPNGYNDAAGVTIRMEVFCPRGGTYRLGGMPRLGQQVRVMTTDHAS